MKLKLDVRPASGGEFGEVPSDCATFMVDIDQDYAKLLLGRVKALRELRKTDSEAYEIYFWDDAGIYMGETDDGKPDMGRVEVGQVIVRENNVCWTAVPKHTDSYIMTDNVEVGTLESIGGAVAAP